MIFSTLELRFDPTDTISTDNAYFLKCCFQDFPSECTISNANPQFGLGKQGYSKGYFPLILPLTSFWLWSKYMPI
jgi:hypothetical protein